jgi:hypothetical protein
MRRAWTVGALLALGLSACSGGTYPSGYYSSGQPFGGEDGEGSGSEDGDTGIDLDGGGPPPPPPGADDGVPPPDNHGECCEGHEGPGCDNKPVQECVCAMDSWCCESEWDDACAALIEQLGCGHCTDAAGDDGPPPPPPGETDGGDDAPPPPAGEESGGDPPPPGGETGDPPPGETGGDDAPPPEDPPAEGGDCCTDNGATAGCADGTVEACVCMQDAYCCDTAWDALCVSEVESFGCGTCGGAGGEGGDEGGGGISACCSDLEGAGCPDATVEACVCAVDDYCCNVAWDLTCVGEVESLSCGSCS